MKALGSNNMDHGTGFLKDVLALLGLYMLLPHLRGLLLVLDPSVITICSALGAVIVGRLIDIAYKEFKARRRQKRFPNEKDYM